MKKCIGCLLKMHNILSILLSKRTAVLNVSYGIFGRILVNIFLNVSITNRASWFRDIRWKLQIYSFSSDKA